MGGNYDYNNLNACCVFRTGCALLFFKFSGNLAKRVSEKNVAKSGTLSAARSQSHMSGEVLAAISAAIYDLKENQHDIESTILTIDRVKRNYSPWNAKRQSLRELPR